VLALSRQPGEGIVIGGVIAVQVVEVLPGQRNRVRLGFHAPRDIEIDRAEVFRDKHGLPAWCHDAAELVELYRAARQGLPHPALDSRNGL
jgi:carbon storage regulator CsrA